MGAYKDITIGQLIEEYSEFASAERELKTRLNRFNEFLTEYSFKKKDSIFSLIKNDPYIIDSYQSEYQNGRKNIDNIFTRQFIDHLREKKIETLPLLPFFYLKRNSYNTNRKKFEFSDRIKKSFDKFMLYLEEDAIPKTELKCILLVCFYHFPIKTLSDLKCEIVEDMGAQKKDDFLRGIDPDHRKFIWKRGKTPIPLTDWATYFLTKGKEPKDPIVEGISEWYLERGFQNYLKKEFSISRQELMETILQCLIWTVGVETALALTGMSTPDVARKRFDTTTISTEYRLYLNSFYPIDKIIG